VNAFNAGRLTSALPVLSPNVVVSDCDYHSFALVQFIGTSQARRWLSGRIADHDRLTIRGVFNAVA
jgi:hypothetical protein